MSNIITLCSPERSDFNSHKILMREDIELEKGVIISQDFLERNEELLKKYLQIFSAYPDVYLDIIKPEASNFNLFPFQRIFLRACMVPKHWCNSHYLHLALYLATSCCRY